ncbi:MAG: hypothetical protein AABW81_04525 [Nanoarchaeota archaeon]
MCDTCGCGGRRNKRRDKLKEKRKHPYRKGGTQRSMALGKK